MRGSVGKDRPLPNAALLPSTHNRVAATPLPAEPLMKVQRPDSGPSRPRVRTLPPGWLVVAYALTPLLLASCTDTLTTNCPPLAHSPILTAAAASNPCTARAGESAIQLRTRVVRVYERTQLPGAGRYPLRCGGDDLGYVHLFARSASAEGDHCDPVNDPSCDEQIAFTLEHGAYLLQANGNPRFTVRFSDARPFEQGPLDTLELLVGEKRRPPGARLPEPADALLFPGMVPDRCTLPRHPQLARHLGRTQALGEQPGGSQPPLLQGAAIPASGLARTLAGTCARTWVHDSVILPSRRRQLLWRIPLRRHRVVSGHPLGSPAVIGAA